MEIAEKKSWNSTLGAWLFAIIALASLMLLGGAYSSSSSVQATAQTMAQESAAFSHVEALNIAQKHPVAVLRANIRK